MNSCTYLRMLSAVFCVFVVVTLSGCNAKETANVEESGVR